MSVDEIKRTTGRDDNEIADAFVAGRAYERSFALVGRVDLPYDAPPFDTERVQRALDLPDPVTGETERDLLRHGIKRRDNRIAFLHDRLQALGQRLVRIRKIAAGVDT